MKNSILTIIIIFGSILHTNSQEIKATYKFDIPVNNKGLQYKEGHKIKVVDTVQKDSISFIYLKFIKEKLNFKYYYKSAGTNDSLVSIKRNGNLVNSDDSLDLKTHTISKSTFNKSTTRYYYYHRFKDVKAGIFTVPFKLRLDDFDFEQNVNLGMSLSFRFRMNRSYNNSWLISPTLGIGLSTIKLNPKNSNLIDTEDSNRTASAFSLSSGILLELKENINLSIQYGFDFLGNDDKEIKWKYDKKPWLGIGISIGFPITEKKSENENIKNN